MLDLVKPAPTRSGDQVGVVAPASPAPPEEIEAGCSTLASLGLNVVTCLNRESPQPSYLAGSDEFRVFCFNEVAGNPQIRALFCARGGYGSLRVLSRLSYERLRQTRKAIIGFSDLTALLLNCYRQARLVCFHGPTVSSLVSADPESVQSLWNALSSTEPLEFHFTEALCLRPGRAVGSVLGGNLTTLCHMIGTPFLPELSGCILFFEDRGEPVYRIDRLLTQLVHSGLLRGVVGLMLGDFSECGPRSEINHLVLERLASTSFPILSGVPIGHEPLNLTLPLGLPATLDAATGSLTYHQAATAI